MKTFNFLSFAIFVTLIFSSCDLSEASKTEDYVLDTSKNKGLNLTETNKNYKSVQFFTIPTNKGVELVGEKGTKIQIPDGCFDNYADSLTVELIECYSLQDFIFNDLYTATTSGEILISDGMIYLNVMSNMGDTIHELKKNLTVLMPTNGIKPNIELFEGIKNRGSIYWVESENKFINRNIGLNSNRKHGAESTNSNDPVIPNLQKDGSAKENLAFHYSVDEKVMDINVINYVFQTSRMGWINCDMYIEGETTPLLVNVPKKNSRAAYYLILKNYNSSVPPKTTNDGKLSFMVPVNEPFTIVAIGTSGKDTYFNMVDYSGGQNEVTFSELKPVTRQELIDLLLKKFGKDIWSRPLA